MAIATYVVFFVAGLGFGFAASGIWKWLPLLLPLVLFLGAALQTGVDGSVLVRLAAALLVTAAGVLLGVVLERRGDRDRRPGYA
jgi:hypothetical protein